MVACSVCNLTPVPAVSTVSLTIIIVLGIAALAAIAALVAVVVVNRKRRAAKAEESACSQVKPFIPPHSGCEYNPYNDPCLAGGFYNPALLPGEPPQALIVNRYPAACLDPKGDAPPKHPLAIYVDPGDPFKDDPFAMAPSVAKPKLPTTPSCPPLQPRAQSTTRNTSVARPPPAKSSPRSVPVPPMKRPPAWTAGPLPSPPSALQAKNKAAPPRPAHQAPSVKHTEASPAHSNHAGNSSAGDLTATDGNAIASLREIPRPESNTLPDDWALMPPPSPTLEGQDKEKSPRSSPKPSLQPRLKSILKNPLPPMATPVVSMMNTRSVSAPATVGSQVAGSHQRQLILQPNAHPRKRSKSVVLKGLHISAPSRPPSPVLDTSRTPPLPPNALRPFILSPQAYTRRSSNSHDQQAPPLENPANHSPKQDEHSNGPLQAPASRRTSAASSASCYSSASDASPQNSSTDHIRPLEPTITVPTGILTDSNTNVPQPSRTAIPQKAKSQYLASSRGYRAGRTTMPLQQATADSAQSENHNISRMSVQKQRHRYGRAGSLPSSKCPPGYI